MAFIVHTTVARADDEIKLEKIKADEVEKMIAAHKGKVVCLDVWADFCAPCKAAFPHLVKLHNEFAKQGLDCISLSIDLEDNLDGAHGFLKAQKATFSNFILWDTDENREKLHAKIPVSTPPLFHVFDRDGKKVKTWDGAIKHDEIHALVQQLLKFKSGPQPGQKVPGPFEPFNVTGVQAGEEACLFCKFGSDPTVMIFAKEISDPLSTLMKRMDDLNIKHKKADLGTCAIFCDKGTKLRADLKKLAAKQDLKEIVLATMEESPPKYTINKDADVTVIIYTGAAVKANYAFRKGELDDKAIEAIEKEVGKVLEK